MGLQQQIVDDLKASMKARDKDRTSALRMVLSQMKNTAIEKGRGPQGELSDDEVQRILASEVKKRRESVTSYRDAGRDEQADREEAEAALYEAYLPEQLSDAEVDAIIDEVIAETGASGMKDMGPTMKAVMSRVGTQADGSRVSQQVKARLSG